MTDEYPNLTDAQVKALDQDGDGKPGGRKRKAAPVAPPAPDQAEIIARAIEQSKKQLDPPKPADFVNVRVLKRGDGVISMGVHVNGIGDAFYRHGEVFATTAENAAELEDRGLVEIEDA